MPRQTVTVAVQQLPHAQGLALPTYQTDGAAGLDLLAAVDEPLTIEPGQRLLVPTGLVIAVPEGYEAQIRMRSGLALRHGLILPNAPGTIDSDYRGEVKVIIANIGDAPATIARGERIAQLVLAPVSRLAWDLRDQLPSTERGGGGFGHTGQ